MSKPSLLNWLGLKTVPLLFLFFGMSYLGAQSLMFSYAAESTDDKYFQSRQGVKLGYHHKFRNSALQADFSLTHASHLLFDTKSQIASEEINYVFDLKYSDRHYLYLGPGLGISHLVEEMAITCHRPFLQAKFGYEYFIADQKLSFFVAGGAKTFLIRHLITDVQAALIRTDKIASLQVGVKLNFYQF